MFQEIRPEAGFETGGFVKEKLGGPPCKRTRLPTPDWLKNDGRLGDGSRARGCCGVHARVLRV